eukprot:gene17238-23562_t
MPLDKICVFCGSSMGVKPAYAEAARSMGRQLSKQRIGLVYGGGSVGLMGEVAREVQNGSGDGSVVGVIPEALKPKELSGETIGELLVVPDMHTRKALMAERSDGFIAMPGGFGTLEEVLEVITWQQLGYHEKPIGFLNTEGFFTPLLAFFDQCVEQGFIRQKHNSVLVSDDPEQLINMMREFKPPPSLIQEHLAAMAAIKNGDVPNPLGP